MTNSMAANRITLSANLQIVAFLLLLTPFAYLILNLTNVPNPARVIAFSPILCLLGGPLVLLSKLPLLAQVMYIASLSALALGVLVGFRRRSSASYRLLCAIMLAAFISLGSVAALDGMLYGQNF